MGFQVGLRVPEGKDVISTYYQACGWHRGYFGMQASPLLPLRLHSTAGRRGQVNSCQSERRVLFSCWDDGTQTKRGNDVLVPDSNPVCLVCLSRSHALL